MLKTLLQQALRALARNKLRSALSALGVSIGAAAVICTIALGNGGAVALRQQLAALGDNLVWVEAGGRTRDGVRLGTHKTKTLLLADAEAIAEQIPLITKISPQVDGRAQIIFGGSNWNTGIKGVTREYFEIRQWTLESGVAFSPHDIEQSANVCVLGQTVVRTLFRDMDPVGKTVRVRHLQCEVIGTLMAKGQSAAGQDQDDQVFMPFTTVQHKITGANWLDDIQCSAVSAELVPLAAEQVSALLRQRHHIVSDEEVDFNIRHPEDAIKVQLAASQTFARWMAWVAAVSLLIGGVGIMNIMMVAVTERTREIGLRLAIGAKHQHIRLQFLTEALLLSLLGGTSGILMGLVGVALLGQSKQWVVQASIDTIAAAGLCAFTVGVVFGYYPAHRATQLDPCEALRQE